jgi:hypothetical protein
VGQLVFLLIAGSLMRGAHSCAQMIVVARLNARSVSNAANDDPANGDETVARRKSDFSANLL